MRTTTGSNVLAFVPASPAHPATHPVFTAADVSRMTASELSYFTDAPVAHVVAQQDYERDLRRLQRDRETARIIASRRRFSELAQG